MYDVAVVKYEKPLESLREAVALVGGLKDVASSSKVVIKPNICGWWEVANFPKYGMLTTARLIEDMLALLNEQGVQDISIVEGPTEIAENTEPAIILATKGMGLDILVKRYGVKIVDVHQGTFRKVTAGDVTFSVNTDILDADYVINMPVLKTHGLSMVSLGIKNLKGILNIASRKKCHNPNPNKDLNYHISKFPDIVKSSLTIIDGIYTLEKGPIIAGEAHRSNILIASKDLLSADKVGTTILGIDPQTIPHIELVAKNMNRPTDLSDVIIRGEDELETVTKPHRWAPDPIQPIFELMGIRGITFPDTDSTSCTYCTDYLIHLGMGIAEAKNKDKPFDDIEILYGKILKPSSGHKHTLLLGQCQVKKNGNNPLINHCVKIDGCPPNKWDFFSALEELRIELPDNHVEWWDKLPESFMGQYVGKSEFDESFYQMQ